MDQEELFAQAITKEDYISILNNIKVLSPWLKNKAYYLDEIAGKCLEKIKDLG